MVCRRRDCTASLLLSLVWLVFLETVLNEDAQVSSLLLIGEQGNNPCLIRACLLPVNMAALSRLQDVYFYL